MVDILHRIGVISPTPESVFEALTDIDKLADWWTVDTKGTADLGGVIEFRFPPVGGFDMKVVGAQPNQRVEWLVIDGPDEWSETTIEFELRQDGDYTIVLFAHRDWKEPGEFMHHCTTKWGQFLMSLKSLVETGQGQPAPRDVQISDWH